MRQENQAETHLIVEIQDRRHYLSYRDPSQGLLEPAPLRTLLFKLGNRKHERAPFTPASFLSPSHVMLTFALYGRVLYYREERAILVLSLLPHPAYNTMFKI